MNKAECQAKAQAARDSMEGAIKRAAQVAAVFGGADSLAQQYMRNVEQARQAAVEWDRLAAMHPAQRAKLLRDGSLPVSMFGF